MTDPKRARSARERLRALTPPPVTHPLSPASLQDLLYGARFTWHSPWLDARAWAERVQRQDLPPAVVSLLGALTEPKFEVRDILNLCDACELVAGDESVAWEIRDRCNALAARYRLIAAFLGDYASLCAILHHVLMEMDATHDDAERRLLMITARELVRIGQMILLKTFDVKYAAKRQARDLAWIEVQTDAAYTGFWTDLEREDRKAGPVRDDTGFDPRDEDFDRAERVVADLLDEAQPEPAGVLVFPQAILAGAGKPENQRDVKSYLGSRLGARLPLVTVPRDWHAWEAPLVAEAPWLAPAVRAVRASQGGREHWGHGVICLVGPAGAGKSRIARRIAAASALPFASVNLDAASDSSSLGGTSIRWSSAHPGVPDGLLARAGTANGVILIDEIDKGAGSRHSGGHPHDLLHGLFERSTAAAWRSPYLLSEIDVSHLLWICTANSVESVPASLRDRMTVVRVDEPAAEHLGILAPALAREACVELGLDERWGELDHEELAALSVWRGGSVRRLQRLVSGILRARDHAPVARH